MNKVNLIVIVLILFLIGTAFYLFYSPYFTIKTVKLRGIDSFDENLISSYMEEYIGQNIVYLKKDKIEKKITNLKYVDNVTFARELPNTAHFVVDESELVFRFIRDENYFYLDENGNIFSDEELKQKIILPVIRGYDIPDNDNKIQYSREMNQFINEFIKYIDRNVDIPSQIIFSNQNVTLNFSEKYDIIFGELENISEKFRVLENVSNQIQQNNYDVNYVDISIYNKPVLKLNQ
ncbi:MAG: cell division protein FtsQ/DivIB [Bacillota bacterium]